MAYFMVKKAMGASNKGREEVRNKGNQFMDDDIAEMYDGPKTSKPSKKKDESRNSSQEAHTTTSCFNREAIDIPEDISDIPEVSITEAIKGLYFEGKEPNMLVLDELKSCFQDLGGLGGTSHLPIEKLQHAYSFFDIHFKLEELDPIIDAFDSSGNNDFKIRFKDFVAEMYEVMSKGTTEQDLRYVFDIMDKNRDGLICEKEISQEFLKLDPRAKREDITKDFAEVDVDGYGIVDYEQFRNYCINKLKLDLPSNLEKSTVVEPESPRRPLRKRITSFAEPVAREMSDLQ